MNTGYFLWKWADNDLPGKPSEVFAALMRGELHTALQPFDARPVLRRLEKLAAKRRKSDEEWDWKVQPADSPAAAHFIHLSCPLLNESYERVRQFSKVMDGLGISGYDEHYGHVIHVFRAKLNCLLFGQDHHERHYDITADDLPVLLRRIDRHDRNPFAVLQDRHRFVQCLADGHRFCVEWRENYDPKNWDDYDHWRASEPRRTSGSKKHDTLLFAATLQIFQAFLRGESKPSQFRWRSIKRQLEKKR